MTSVCPSRAERRAMLADAPIGWLIPALSTGVYRLAVLIAAAGSTAWRVYTGWLARRAVMQLAQFDDRMLKDIGLQRADIDWAMMQPLTSDPSAALAERVERRRAAAQWGRRLNNAA